jgi:arylsulfatase A-like enzyme
VTRPNFLVIVADDLGFSDIGAFGSGHVFNYAGQIVASFAQESMIRRIAQSSPE